MSSDKLWDRLFRSHGVKIIDYLADSWISQNLHLLGKPRGVLLDAGCGFGRHLREAVRHGWYVVGLDRSITVLMHLMATTDAYVRESSVLACSDLHSRILAAGTCRAGICTDVMSVVCSPSQVLTSLRACASADALFLLTFQSINDETCGTGARVAEEPALWIQYEQDGINYRFYTKTGVATLLSHSGWRLLNIEEFSRVDLPHEHRPYEHEHVLYGCVVKAEP